MTSNGSCPDTGGFITLRAIKCVCYCNIVLLGWPSPDLVLITVSTIEVVVQCSQKRPQRSYVRLTKHYLCKLWVCGSHFARAGKLAHLEDLSNRILQRREHPVVHVGITVGQIPQRRGLYGPDHSPQQIVSAFPGSPLRAAQVYKVPVAQISTFRSV